MRNRFANAIAIQNPGASNPSGVARALVEALDEARAENVDTRTDPACRMICHQLAFLMGVGEIDHSLDEYARLMKICEERGKP